MKLSKGPQAGNMRYDDKEARTGYSHGARDTCGDKSRAASKTLDDCFRVTGYVMSHLYASTLTTDTAQGTE